MPHRDIVVIGASAGGYTALRQLAAHLPADLPATLFIVIHSSPDSPAALASLLTKDGPLPASYPEHLERFLPGRIYVAPPDRHLLLSDGVIHVTRGPRENGFRPAVDPLFRTAAEEHGARVVGIVLSGALDDGTYGLQLIKQHGGIAVAQDIEEATVSSMPLSAIRNVKVDHILKVADMGALLARLARQSVRSGRSKRRKPVDTAEVGTRDLEQGIARGTPSQFTFPDCGGSLAARQEKGVDLFQCHVGHRYTTESLASGLNGRLEAAMWTAFRTLEENASFQRHLVRRARNHGLDAVAAGHEKRAQTAEANAAILQSVLADITAPPLSEITQTIPHSDKRPPPRPRRKTPAR